MSRVPVWLRVAVLVAALIAILATIAFEPARSQSRQRAVLTTQVIKAANRVAECMHVSGAIEVTRKNDVWLVEIELEPLESLLSAPRKRVRSIDGSSHPVEGEIATRGTGARRTASCIAQATPVAAVAVGVHLGAATSVRLVLLDPLQADERRLDDRDEQTRASRAVDQRVGEVRAVYRMSLERHHDRAAEWADTSIMPAAAHS